VAGDVVEVRPSRGVAAQSFTAGEITSGAMVDFVNGGTTDLYNSARWFNGTSTAVSVPTQLSDVHNFDITIDALIGSIPAGMELYAEGNTAVNTQSLIFQVSFTGKLRFILTDNSGTVAIDLSSATSVEIGNTYTTRILNVNGSVTLYLDGISVATGSYTPSGTFTLNTANIGVLVRTAPIGAFSGLLFNANIDGVVAYTGLGTSVTAWEDTIGSNDGTETNGAAYTGQGFDGFVSTWYDQSGNANNATQATTTAQPKIVSAGTLVSGGIDFDGVDDGLKTTSALTNALTEASVFIVSKNDLSTGQQSMFRIRPNGAVGALDGMMWEQGSPPVTNRYGGNTLIEGGGNAVGADSSGVGVQDTNEHLVSLLFQQSQMLAYEDSALDQTMNTVRSGALPIGSVTLASPLWIGLNFDSNDRGFNGKMSELIIYFDDQSANRVAIETNINAAYSIF
tara:strand:- start:1269 stop:2624 length:1356 start_codon:yes stop_codon:yes gene_type:complete